MEVDLSATKLDRCLTTFDLTALGIGSTLGLGIYVLAGEVASEKSGPAVTVSFFVAAVASVFAGLCYAEFGARVPRAGSAYVYSYVTVGEFMAFIIGWNLILEYVIGTASVARGYSGYIDYLCNNTIRKHMEEAMPISIATVSPYPDFLALGITLFLTVMLAVGVKESSRFNNIFTGLNLMVVVFAIIAGSIKADIHNWKLDKSEIPESAGEGGFFPYGVSGMMSGAATCFFGFIGFDCIATTGEEVKNPQKSIPISIVLSLLFIFLAYFGVSAVQTLMYPYYLQSNEASLPFVFEMVGWDVARYIISAGALAGLSTSLLGAMFPLPRVLYAMATDGVIFRFLANVHPRSKTPLIATMISGLFSGLMAMIFQVRELADMMSIGTLLAYTLVAVSVLVIRYRDTEDGISICSEPKYVNISPKVEKNGCIETSSPNPCSISSSFELPVEKYSCSKIFRQLLNVDGLRTPNHFSSQVSIALIIISCILVVTLDGVLAWSEPALMRFDLGIMIVLSVLVILIVVTLVLLRCQPVDDMKISFRVPLVPFVPMLSVGVNVYLMFKLSVLTWQRFGGWMAMGFCVYFFYGLWHSSERKTCVPGPVNHSASCDSHLVSKLDSPSIDCNGPRSSIGSCFSELTESGPTLETSCDEKAKCVEDSFDTRF